MQVTLFHFEDKPRPGVASVISEVKDHAKLRVMMLTGDHESSALRVANTVGISEVYSSLKPEDKLNKVKNISRDMGEIPIFVEDYFFIRETVQVLDTLIKELFLCLQDLSFSQLI